MSSRYEAPDMAAFLRRVSKALVRRAAEGDLETLSAIQQVQRDMETALAQAAHAAHAAGYSWTEIGRELGISRQGARQRFAEDLEAVSSHQSRCHEPSYKDGRHWAAGEVAVQHPGRLADCALCLTTPGDASEVSPLY